MECKYHAHFTSRTARGIDILEEEFKQQSLNNNTELDIVFVRIGMRKREKVKENIVVLKKIQCTIFFI